MAIFNSFLYVYQRLYISCFLWTIFHGPYENSTWVLCHDLLGPSKWKLGLPHLPTYRFAWVHWRNLHLGCIQHSLWLHLCSLVVNLLLLFARSHFSVGDIYSSVGRRTVFFDLLQPFIFPCCWHWYLDSFQLVVAQNRTHPKMDSHFPES